ncbi:MAG: restriction endonuclease subunit S [Methylobacter sp.]
MELKEASANYLLQAKQKIPKGYNQTEVGLIPEEWSVKTLSALSTMKSGESITSANIDQFSRYPCYGGNGLRGYTTRFTHDGSHALIGRQGALCGNVLGVEGKFFASEHAIVVTPISSIDIRWLTFVLGEMQLNKYSESSAQPGLSVAKVLSLAIAAPPTTAEQEAIAEALSDADALIEAQEQLIAKKRQLKQGAMQELLTGKCRLPGFSGNWQTKLLGDLINDCSSGATPYRGNPDFYRGTIKWITSGELNYNVIMDTIEHISKEAVEKTNLKIHPSGTFLMAITGLEAAGTRGSCGIVGSPSTTNQSCMAIYPTPELKTEYLFHYYVLRGNELALHYCQGTKQQSYTAKLVRLLPIELPPKLEEQTAIAQNLTDMDAEIAELESKLAKARAVKQGMMQQLLTGKIRLV